MKGVHEWNVQERIHPFILKVLIFNIFFIYILLHQNTTKSPVLSMDNPPHNNLKK